MIIILMDYVEFEIIVWVICMDNVDSVDGFGAMPHMALVFPSIVA